MRNAPSGDAAVPDLKYLADRLRAHARLYRHIAEQTWNEDKAAELVHLANECTQAADAIAAGVAGDETAPHPRRLHSCLK
jgi:hypothetical protein